MLNCKRTVSIALFAALPFLILAGCNSGEIPDAKDVKLTTTIDSVSYSIGQLYGSQLRNQGMTDLKLKKLLPALKSAINGEDPKLDRQKIQEIMQAYQLKARQNAQKLKNEASNANKKAAQEFLDENISKEGVNMTESGMQYKILEEGTGASPTTEDTVRVHYVGSLLDGSIFDTSIKEIAQENGLYNEAREPYEGTEFPLSGVIKGWTEGLQLMKEGAKYKFWIPGELAYGENPPPNGPIDPSEMLIFEIELLEVK